MANSKQARKRAEQSAIQNVRNSALRSRARTALRSVRKSIESGDAKLAAAALQKATKVIDSVADKGVIHKNTAARQKSRLSAAIKALG